MAKRNISEWAEEEISGIVFESEDEDASDSVEFEDDDDSDSDFEPQPEDFIIDEEELISTVERIESSQHSSTERGTRPSTSQEGSETNTNQKTVRNKKRSKSAPPTTCDNVTLKWDEEHVIGKNGFEWATSPIAPTSQRTRGKNVVHIKPGSAGNARFAKQPIECFKLFFTPNMMTMILEFTNKEILREREKYKNGKNSTLGDTCEAELFGLFGSLIYAAAMKHNHLNSRILHDLVMCGDFHRSVLSESRFSFLITTLRFDDRETRSERNSKFGPIADVWEMLIENCKMNYKPGTYITIDEQLIGFRGLCPFRMYIPSKPNKYGLKIIMICDNSTKYMINAMPYLGKGSTPQGTSAATHFTLELIAPISGSNRQLTMDNWFTSIPLAKTLLKDHKITVLGTVRKDKREFPQGFSDIKFKTRKPGSSLFLFEEDITAVSYKPTLKKLVTLISTTHDDDSVSEPTGKPEMILNYNETKGAVDVFDRLCQDNNCGRKTKRWPLAIFYNMLNIATQNAYVIYLHNFYRDASQEDRQITKKRSNSKSKRLQSLAKPLSRFEFLVKLAEQLSEEWMRARKTIPTMRKNILESIERCLERNITDDPPAEALEQQPLAEVFPAQKRTYCRFCSYEKRRKTASQCKKCAKPICGEHIVKYCVPCHTSQDENH